MYENNFFNAADFYNLLSVFFVKYLDQYFACQYDVFLGKVDSRVTGQPVIWRGEV